MPPIDAGAASGAKQVESMSSFFTLVRYLSRGKERLIGWAVAE
jgi:hypothetical protein